jgi:hypothetical protein
MKKVREITELDEPLGIIISRGDRPERRPIFSAYIWAPAPEPVAEVEAHVEVEDAVSGHARRAGRQVFEQCGRRLRVAAEVEERLPEAVEVVGRVASRLVGLVALHRSTGGVQAEALGRIHRNQKTQAIQITPRYSSESALNFNKTAPFPLIHKQFFLDSLIA